VEATGDRLNNAVLLKGDWKRGRKPVRTKPPQRKLVKSVPLKERST